MLWFGLKIQCFGNKKSCQLNPSFVLNTSSPRILKMLPGKREYSLAFGGKIYHHHHHIQQSSPTIHKHSPCCWAQILPPKAREYFPFPGCIFKSFLGSFCSRRNLDSTDKIFVTEALDFQTKSKHICCHILHLYLCSKLLLYFPNRISHILLCH